MDLHWYELKEPIANVIGLSRPMLHVLVGAATFLVSAWLLRRRRFMLLYAWLAVFTIELINETADAYDWIRWTGSINTADAVEDILLTMLFPTGLVLTNLIRGFDW